MESESSSKKTEEPGLRKRRQRKQILINCNTMNASTLQSQDSGLPEDEEPPLSVDDFLEAAYAQTCHDWKGQWKYWTIILSCGVANSSDASEILCISYILSDEKFEKFVFHSHKTDLSPIYQEFLNAEKKTNIKNITLSNNFQKSINEIISTLKSEGFEVRIINETFN